MIIEQLPVYLAEASHFFDCFLCMDILEAESVLDCIILWIKGSAYRNGYFALLCIIDFVCIAFSWQPSNMPLSFA